MSYSYLRIVQGLNHLDFCITIICPEISIDYQNQSDIFQKKYSIKIFDRLKLGQRKGFIKHLRYIFYNRNILKLFIGKNQTSLIHCFNPPDIIPLIASKLAIKKKIPFIFHIADPGPESMAAIFYGFKKSYSFF